MKCLICACIEIEYLNNLKKIWGFTKIYYEKRNHIN